MPRGGVAFPVEADGNREGDAKIVYDLDAARFTEVDRPGLRSNIQRTITILIGH
jgi:hypothetical protein